MHTPHTHNHTHPRTCPTTPGTPRTHTHAHATHGQRGTHTHAYAKHGQRGTCIREVLRGAGGHAACASQHGLGGSTPTPLMSPTRHGPIFTQSRIVSREGWPHSTPPPQSKYLELTGGGVWWGLWDDLPLQQIQRGDDQLGQAHRHRPALVHVLALLHVQSSNRAQDPGWGGGMPKSCGGLHRS